MTQRQNETRLPWVALALSFLSMGVGHIYCGRIVKGLVLYVAWFVIPVLGLIAALLPPSALSLTVLVLFPILALLGLYFHAALDAYEAAKRADPAYTLQDYNRAGIYWLLIFVQLACPIALTLGMREFVFEAFYIPTRNMNPTIVKGDRILVNKLIAESRFPERGDLVVFYNPEPDGGRHYVKRIIGLAGDDVLIQDDRVEINGDPLPRDRIPADALRHLKEQAAGESFYETNAGRRYKVAYGDSPEGHPEPQRLETTVPPRHVFVLGDNRDRSRDSRSFGPIHTGDIVGYVQYNFFPAESFSRFGVITE